MFFKRKNLLLAVLGISLALAAGLRIRDMGFGSGVVVDADRKTLTNGHIVNDAGRIYVGPIEKTIYKELGLSVADIEFRLQEKFELPGKQNGVVITDIAPNSVASTGGLEEGDVVLRLNRIDVGSVEEFDEVMGTLDPGDNALFYVARRETKFFAACEVPKT